MAMDEQIVRQLVADCARQAPTGFTLAMGIDHLILVACELADVMTPEQDARLLLGIGIVSKYAAFEDFASMLLTVGEPTRQ